MYDSDNDDYIPVYRGDVNTDRLPARQQLDLRVDKYWIFDQWILSTYLDFQNVFMRDNVIGIQYSRNYEEKTETKMIPFMLFFGIKGDF